MSNKTIMIESCEKKIVAEDFSNTSIVHVRNSKILEKELGYPLVTHFSQIPDFIDRPWDNIICHYASPYMKYKMYIELLQKNPNATVYWMINDHDGEDNILLRNYLKEGIGPRYNMICNNPRSGYRHWILGKNILGKKLNDFIHRWYTLNLNSLIFQEVVIDESERDKKDGIIYYGTPRKHRYDDMAHFNGIYNYTISSSNKNQKKYDEAGITCSQFIDKISWTIGEESLRNYKYSIYFEDLWTHTNFAFLANRYYECLMFDVLMFFDKKCSNTINTARDMGYNIQDFMIVEDAQELNFRMKMLNDSPEDYLCALREQSRNKKFVLNERRGVLNKIRNIMNHEY